MLRAIRGSLRRGPTAVAHQRALISSSTVYASARPEPETKVTTLKNGLRVASEDIGGETCTVGLYLDAGSRYETKENNGVAHFVEHMIFKGTQKRNRVQLEKEIENMGAHLNAYTSREQTAYYARCLKKDVDQAVDILSDIVLNSTFDDKDIEAERYTILREMEEVDKNMQEVVFDYLHGTAFQGTSLAYTILGPSANVEKNITRQHLIDYVRQHYKAPRCVLACSGGVPHDKLAALAEEKLGGMSATYENGIPSLPVADFTGSDMRHRDDEMKYAHIAYAVRACGWSNADSLILMLANNAIGQYDSTQGAPIAQASRLAIASVRDSLCESFQAFTTFYSDTGLFGVYYTVPANDELKGYAMAEAIAGEWKRLAYTVTQYELDRLKAQLKMNLQLQLDGTQARCEDIGRNVLVYDRRVPFAELESRIDSISLDLFTRVMHDYIVNVEPAMASIGPVYAVPDINHASHLLAALRG